MTAGTLQRYIQGLLLSNIAHEGIFRYDDLFPRVQPVAYINEPAVTVTSRSSPERQKWS